VDPAKPSEFEPSLRATAGAIAAAAIALLAVLQNTDQLSLYATSLKDPYKVVAQDQRLQSARARLKGQNLVGYFSDVAPADERGQAIFLASQFSLAPTVLVQQAQGDGPQYWIGNFSKPVDFVGEGQSRGLRFSGLLDNGVALYVKERR
jgi:hypothetical protein